MQEAIADSQDRAPTLIYLPLVNLQKKTP